MIRHLLHITTLFIGYTSLVAQTSFDSKITSASNVRLSIANNAIFGNNFEGYRDGSGNPSAEYPAGSGIEHVFEGGIWIGGIDQTTGQPTVSTSAYDASSGYSPGSSGFEFTTAIGSTLQERSSLFDSKYFDPAAVSHQDYVSDCTDENVLIPGTQIQITDHVRPMNVNVHMETYNWNYSFSNFFVIVNLEITNNGSSTFDDLYVGLWNNTVVRNVNITPASSGGSSFYNKGGNGFMDSLALAYCYDATGDVGFTDSYVGQAFLGAEDQYGFHHPNLDSSFNPLTGAWELDDFEINYQGWEFNNNSNPIFFFPSSESARYNKMKNGLNQSPCWTDPTGVNCPSGTDLQGELNKPGNRSDLISAGPFDAFAPGETINIAFAYIFAKKNEDGNPNTDNNLTQRQLLIDHATWAQQAFNGEDQNFNGILDEGEDLDGNGKITRFILPSPPDIPRTKVIPSENKIEIYWADNSRYSLDPISNEYDFEGYRVYISDLGFDVTGTPNLAEDFKLIGQYDIRGNGLFYETGFESVALDEPKYFEGDTTAYVYKYTVENIADGWQYAAAVTSFDRGNPESNLESLESSFLSNNFRAFPGTPANDNMDENAPYAFPNPYYYGAAWEGQSNFQEESRKLIFANLPQRCKIRVFTVAGDFIDEINHDPSYNGEDIRWFTTFGAEDPDENVFSGGQHAWDLLSLDSQIISRGLYIFSVEDLETGKIKTGKFIIIK